MKAAIKPVEMLQTLEQKQHNAGATSEENIRIQQRESQRPPCGLVVRVPGC
jgi:hypothetical protein